VEEASSAGPATWRHMDLADRERRKCGVEGLHGYAKRDGRGAGEGEGWDGIGYWG
jgi:hypothetical protein